MAWVFAIQWIIHWFEHWCWQQGQAPVVSYRNRRDDVDSKEAGFRLHTAKPEWVISEVIRLKAHMPTAGCRTVAHTFNRIHGPRMTVSKSYVYDLFVKYRHEILIRQQRIKQRRPYHYQKNQLWQIDITKLNGQRLLGVIDCGSRACLALQSITNKRSLTILIHLLRLINQYGKPTAIRSDNEACFTARLIRISLYLLGINKQTTQLASPWQNGRIERLFGTLKSQAKQRFIDKNSTQTALNEFQFWYNSVRPHQALDGRTPTEAWNGKTPKQSGKARYVTGWDGVLNGVYVPPD